MGYLLKLMYILAILVPAVNSSEALSNVFSTDVLAHYKMQQDNMVVGNDYLIGRDQLIAMANAEPRYFADTQSISNGNTNGAAFACHQMRSMTNDSLNHGRVVEAKALNFYHGLVTQAAKHNGYDKC